MTENLLQKGITARPVEQSRPSASIVLRVIRFDITGDNPNKTGRYNYLRPFLPIGTIPFDDAGAIWGLLAPNLGGTAITGKDGAFAGVDMAEYIADKPSLLLFYQQLRQTVNADNLSFDLQKTVMQQVLFYAAMIPEELWHPPVTGVLSNDVAEEHQIDSIGILILEKR